MLDDGFWPKADFTKTTVVVKMGDRSIGSQIVKLKL